MRNPRPLVSPALRARLLVLSIVGLWLWLLAAWLLRLGYLAVEGMAGG